PDPHAGHHPAGSRGGRRRAGRRGLVPWARRLPGKLPRRRADRDTDAADGGLVHRCAPDALRRPRLDRSRGNPHRGTGRARPALHRDHPNLKGAMSQYGPRVDAALAPVDEDAYTLKPDGSLVTQTTATPLIATTLDSMDLRPGMRVLEIGTGSGFSGALLGELVGASGTVVSVDVVPDLIARARTLHQQAGRTNVTLLAADGHQGAPDHAPFDRIVAWTTPELIPHTWVEQTRPGGLIIAPVELAGLVKT